MSEKPLFGRRPVPKPDFSEAYQGPLNHLGRDDVGVVKGGKLGAWLPGHSSVPYIRLQRQTPVLNERRHR
jgi:hypothetical protein